MAGFGLAIGIIALAGGPGTGVAQGAPQPPMAADIVFIYDNSGSMWSHYAKIDSLESDTTFYQSTCFGSALPPGMPFTYITASGPRTIELLPNSAVCRLYAGDPYQVRTSIISQAIDYLAVRSPNSTAGAMAFAANVGHVRPPLSLSVPGNTDLVKASLAMDSISATNYVPPLQLATTWLNDSSLAPAAGKAIVFISDGEPTDGSAFMAWVNTHRGYSDPRHSPGRFRPRFLQDADHVRLHRRQLLPASIRETFPGWAGRCGN